MAILLLTAVTRVERKLATSLVFETVNRFGGWIDDVQMYSNLMNTIRFTLPGEAFGSLIEALRADDISVDAPLDLAESGNSAAERMATLQITFIHDEPDLKREIPSIPG